MTRAVVAHKHSSEYLIHKYWSRKPANIVRLLLEQYSRPGDLVLDPFCGSGVTLIEAVKLNRRAIGVDINPIAALVSRVSTRCHELARIGAQWRRLLEAWKPLCVAAYTTSDGRQVKHCVHTPVITCASCRRTSRAEGCPKKGRRYRCPQCNEVLNAGLSRAAGTVVTAVQCGSEGLVLDEDLVAEQTQTAALRCCTETVWSRFDIPLVPNTRILAQPGMSTSSLFTPRNFSLIAQFAKLVHDTEMPDDIKDVLLLVLTSAVASCSRLIAYRDNMARGGPAWTVPGFWVPPLHLERNPLDHLIARYKKVEKGLAVLSRHARPPFAEVYLDDSHGRLQKLHASGVKADYLFADPPYGDSVPFLEFSQIWNCWDRRSQPAFQQEIVVSDRTEPRSHWEEYEVRLSRVLHECRNLLADDGHLTVTFNNLEVRAWHALLRALQASRFRCVDVMYQVPAVISAKAAFTPTSSYLGDVYATFDKAPAEMSYEPWRAVQARLEEACELRSGAVSRVTQLRVAGLSILEQNVDAQCILTLDEQLSRLPAKTPPIPDGSPLFGWIERAIVESCDESRIAGGAGLCAAVISRMPVWLGLDQHEILDVARRSGRFGDAHLGAAPAR